MRTASGHIITDWKRLWQLVSGIHYETPEQTVNEELLSVSKELQDGLLQFKPMSSSDANLENLLKEKKQQKLFPFTKKLQEFLNLESKQCWEILCYYLTNEYRGSASSLANFISTESSMTTLLDDIWGYYSLERMIVLKIVKNLLLFYKNDGHPYQQEYKLIVEQITLKNLRDSYIEQFEYLINDKPPSKIMSGEFINHTNKLSVWYERNAREINEVLQIILLIVDQIPIEVKQLKKIFICFKQHSFGKEQQYLNSANDYHNQLMTNISYSEIVLFIKCIDFSNIEASAEHAKEIIKTLDNDISNMYQNSENGPLLLSWMLLNIRYKNTIDIQQPSLKHRQLGARAVFLDVFGFLKKLVSCHMFSDDSLPSKIARRCIYNQLTYLCDLFDGDGSVAQHANIYELLCKLLSWPELAKDFCEKEDEGVRSLYNTVLEGFPIEFIRLSNIADSLTKGGKGDYVKSQLESLPIYTEIYDEGKYILSLSTAEGEYVLDCDFSPFPRITYTIPRGTLVAIMERSSGVCAHFRTSVNYFDVLHNEINYALIETTQQFSDIHRSERVKRVTAGIKYLHSAIAHVKSLSEISVEMVHPTEMCVDLMHRFKKVQVPPVQLLSNCLNVCTELLPLVDEDIFKRVINLNLMPAITNDTLDDYKQYSYGTCSDSGLVGIFLVDVEKKIERYDFLLAYLHFLRTYTKMKKNRPFQVEIPGLIFLLRDVFPHMHAWRYRSNQDKNKIYSEIMGFICDILDTITHSANNNTLEDSNKRLLRGICVYSLLNIENGLILLKFIAIGNPFLQLSMEMELNWMMPSAHSLMHLVRLSMRILMQLLRLKTTVFDKTELSPLEALIYTQPKQRDTLRIIPVVTSYMSNIFDRWLPILSCRLLKRIALEFNMSLLACLDMEPDQIRMTFLQKLLEDLESDSLKIAILELVEACIEKQPGVTEAFFKVNFDNEKRLFGRDKKSDIADSIVTFMEDYLSAVKKNYYIVENPLSSRIMSLFHALWNNNMQSLVDELIKKPQFWESLCNPIFSDEYSPNVRAYSQILSILGIEIFCTSNKINANLKQVITRFFNEEHFERWLDCVFDMPQITTNVPSHGQLIADETPEWLSRLQAFKEFLLILLRKTPQLIKIPPKKYKLLCERCLQVLVLRSEFTDDLRPFIILSETYLLLILNVKHSYTESLQEDQEMLRHLIRILSRVASCYEDLHERAKIACLSFTIKCADLLAFELLKDATIALTFLNSVVSIICLELSNLENEVKAEIKLPKQQQQQLPQTNPSYTLILNLNLLKTIAGIFHNEGPGNWDVPFKANKVFNRLLSCTGRILQLFSKRKLSVELLDVLIVFAKGNFSREFLFCDIGDYLWLKLLPPKDLLKASYDLKQPPADNWSVEQWWPIYSRGVEIVTILFQKHGHEFLKDVLIFVGIHEEYLMDSLLLGKQSLEPKAMHLIKSTAMLMEQLVNYEKEWRIEHPHSLFNLMRCVQMLMGHSISMFHQPRNVKILVSDRRTQLDIMREPENIGLVDEVISAFNDLTEIIILCTRCLLRFSPDLLDLICAPEFLACQWEPLFEIHFGAPKLNDSSMQLTFGTVLSVVGIFTKVLNVQNYGFHEVPLNVLPSNMEVDGDATDNSSSTFNVQSASTVTTSSARPFSKSMSVTSVSSVIASPHELLSNLDTEISLMALEHILMLAASQSLLALKNSRLPVREKQLIRREISTELLTYHEFVRKKILIEFRDHKEMWHRRKHGQVFMMPSSSSPPTSSAAPSTSAGARRQSDHQNSMRVNVVRRLHLQQQQQHHQRTPHPNTNTEARVFDMSQPISPIGSSGSNEPISSTPHLAPPPISRPAECAESERNEVENDSIDYLPPKEPKYSPLSFVQLVEEDYLHFMSNLFTVICQSD